MGPSTDAIGMLYVVRAYIHDRKGVWVNINYPDTPERMALLERAYLVALAWYS